MREKRRGSPTKFRERFFGTSCGRTSYIRREPNILERRCSLDKDLNQICLYLRSSHNVHAARGDVVLQHCDASVTSIGGLLLIGAGRLLLASCPVRRRTAAPASPVIFVSTKEIREKKTERRLFRLPSLRARVIIKRSDSRQATAILMGRVLSSSPRLFLSVSAFESALR